MRNLLMILTTCFLLGTITGCFDDHSHNDGGHGHDEPQEHKNSIN